MKGHKSDKDGELMTFRNVQENRVNDQFGGTTKRYYKS